MINSSASRRDSLVPKHTDDAAASHLQDARRPMHAFPRQIITAANSRGRDIDPAKVEALTFAAIKGRKPRAVIAGYYLAKSELSYRGGIGIPWVKTGESHGPPMQFTDAERSAAQEFASAAYPQVSFSQEQPDRYSRRMSFRVIFAIQKAGRDIAGLEAGIKLFAELRALESASPVWTPPPKQQKTPKPQPAKVDPPKVKPAAMGKVGLGSFIKR